MAQPVAIMAFRKRLFKRGYRSIHIGRVIVDEDGHKQVKYLVEAVEPLAGMGVQCIMSEWDMMTAMR